MVLWAYWPLPLGSRSPPPPPKNLMGVHGSSQSFIPRLCMHPPPPCCCVHIPSRLRLSPYLHATLASYMHLPCSCMYSCTAGSYVRSPLLMHALLPPLLLDALTPAPGCTYPCSCMHRPLLLDAPPPAHACTYPCSCGNRLPTSAPLLLYALPPCLASSYPVLCKCVYPLLLYIRRVGVIGPDQSICGASRRRVCVHDVLASKRHSH